MLFQELPLEVQLNALSQCQPPLAISQQVDYLTKYIQSSKAQHYLSHNELSLSLFCCQSKQQTQKLIYKLERCSGDEYKITELLKSQDIIPGLTNKKSHVPFESENHLDLVQDEEATSLKIYLQLRFNETLLQESTLKLQTNELSRSSLDKVTESLGLQLQIQKGQEEETFGYDFENKINHSLNITKVRIMESELVRLIETKQGETIVRF